MADKILVRRVDVDVDVDFIVLLSFVVNRSDAAYDACQPRENDVRANYQPYGVVGRPAYRQEIYPFPCDDVTWIFRSILVVRRGVRAELGFGNPGTMFNLPGSPDKLRWFVRY